MFAVATTASVGIWILVTRATRGPTASLESENVCQDYTVDSRSFERIVRDVVESLPEQFRDALENLAIVVLEEPDPGDLLEFGLSSEDSELFGLYQGVPLTERGSSYMGLPDSIEIYMGPILRSCDSVAEIAAEIRDTLIHELGHHMGLHDDEMPY